MNRLLHVCPKTVKPCDQVTALSTTISLSSMKSRYPDFAPNIYLQQEEASLGIQHETQRGQKHTKIEIGSGQFLEKALRVDLTPDQETPKPASPTMQNTLHSLYILNPETLSHLHPPIVLHH